jgi:hypothetical protein
MRHFIIDTDTASDDAVALVMALRYPGVNVEAITIVAGNVPVDQLDMFAGVLPIVVIVCQFVFFLSNIATVNVLQFNGNYCN